MSQYKLRFRSPKAFVLGLFVVLIFLSNFFFVSCDKTEIVKKNYFLNNSIKEIDSLISLVKESDYSDSSKIRSLDTAYGKILELSNDSLRGVYLLSASYRYYKLKKYKNFQRLNFSGVNLAKKVGDTNSIALGYWDLASYYKNIRFVNDSAYYYYNEAHKLYSLSGNKINSAKMLYSMALVQMAVKDFISAEVSISKAIPIFKDLNKNTNLYSCYNSLGIINNGLEEFDKANTYYDKALEYIPDNSKNILQIVRIINNKGANYKDQKNYLKAVETYSEAFKYDSIYYKSPKLYAFLLNNNAYSKFKLNDTLGVFNLFNKALVLRDSLGVKSDIARSKLNLSEYFAFRKDSLKAMEYAFNANKLSVETGNNENLLDSYLLLADLDKEKGVDYAKMHIALNDSLQKEERKIRNKFARIQFETEEIQDRNEQLSKQRYWITALLAATVLVALLGWIIFSQRSRNKALEFERMQQRANEEIYSLMLAQQTKLEEGSQREKKRVSEELHDGILGRMFGTRLSLGSLNDKDDPESKKTRQLYLEELKSIEEEVRSISHELSNAMFNSERSYISMVSELLDTQSRITDFDYTVDSDYSIDWDHVSGNMKINLYRIIQESVQNINKYAKASKVTINFEKIENSFVLSIKDDGVGFDINTKKKGIGLKNIRSRVNKLGGELNITSEKNKGTSIHIQVPFKIIVKNEETV